MHGLYTENQASPSKSRRNQRCTLGTWRASRPCRSFLGGGYIAANTLPSLAGLGAKVLQPPARRFFAASTSAHKLGLNTLFMQRGVQIYEEVKVESVTAPQLINFTLTLSTMTTSSDHFGLGTFRDVRLVLQYDGIWTREQPSESIQTTRRTSTTTTRHRRPVSSLRLVMF